MINGRYISDKFAEDFAKELLEDTPDKAIRYFRDMGTLKNCYDNLEDALAAMGVHTMKDAYKLAIRNPSEINLEAKLFRVEDGVFTSGDSLLDFYQYGALVGQIVNNVLNNSFGENYWALKKYAYRTSIGNKNYKGYLCSIETMRGGTLATIIELLNMSNRDVELDDDLCDLLEELGFAVIEIEDEM